MSTLRISNELKFLNPVLVQQILLWLQKEYNAKVYLVALQRKDVIYSVLGLGLPDKIIIDVEELVPGVITFKIRE